MSKQSNVVFIISDDHRYSALNCAGDKTVNTPNLDALASEGTRFEQTHIMGGMSAAVCMPSRSCILTGASVFRCVKDNKLDPSFVLWPEAMRQAGYSTYGIGKWHNGTEAFNRCFAEGNRIFFGGMNSHYEVPLHEFDPTGTYSNDSRYALQEHSTDIFTDAAVRFLEEYDSGKPFALYLAYTAPHDPRTAPEEFRARYRDEDMPLPPNVLPEHPFDNGEMSIRDEQLEAWPRTPEAIQRHIADYYAMISHMDDGIGKVMQKLEERGLSEDTIIVYTADHGLAVGQHGLMGKQNMYDHSIRVPLIFRGPGVPHGKTVLGLNNQLDLFRTLCDLTGATVPEGVEGLSLLPYFQEDNSSSVIRKTVCSAYKNLQRMVKNERWKLIYYVSPEDTTKVRIQLFDLKLDPWELEDVSGIPGNMEHIKDLYQELLLWQMEAGDSLELPLPY
ncbi:sulfatase-like hydrolase/transferase [Paenibacillus sp. UNC451MF]|uniref:sulfatase-like hydrolase/transferase n=1 Tax=Paenibacillus sp. UNC451MF TaxID=1449063 RepID=UPI00068F2395|nr:sulfatase-like hydrolase/transferase [Paenibacillus sp. UNC451MF]